VPRKVEDDELPFDPKTLVPKAPAPVTPGIDLEADAPASPQATEEVEEPEDEESEEPTEEEIEASQLDPDSPNDDHEEEDVPIAADEPMRV
jgi:hypothetical protein